MRATVALLCVLFAPALSAAQDDNNSTMVVVGGKTLGDKAAATGAPAPASPVTQPAASAAPVSGGQDPLPKVPPVPPNFPEWAISSAGQNTSGNTNPEPATPASPKHPAAPANAASSKVPDAPANPATPESPINKLWPRDTVPIFVKSCVGFHVELIPACTCVITTLMATMPHDEFLKLSADGAIESDQRLVNARSTCAVTPERK